MWLAIAMLILSIYLKWMWIVGTVWDGALITKGSYEQTIYYFRMTPFLIDPNPTPLSVQCKTCIANC